MTCGVTVVQAARMLMIPRMLTTRCTEVHNSPPILRADRAQIIAVIRVRENRPCLSLPRPSQQQILCRVFDHKDMRLDRDSSNINRNIMTHSQTRTSNPLIIPKPVDMPLDIFVDREIQAVECSLWHDINFGSAIKQGFNLDRIVDCGLHPAGRTGIKGGFAGNAVDTGANDAGSCRHRRNRLRSELFNRYSSFPSLLVNECRKIAGDREELAQRRATGVSKIFTPMSSTDNVSLSLESSWYFAFGS